MSKLKSIPAFKSEAEERKFWETHDSIDYIDWSKAERVRFPNLKPSTTAISIRLPLGLLEQIKIAADKVDLPVCWIPIRKQTAKADAEFGASCLGRAGRGAF